MLIADENVRKDWIEKKHMKAFNFYKGERSYEEVDIIIDSPIDYKTAARDAIKTRVRNFKLPVISAKNFIKMKKASGREQDLNDIEAIRTIEKLK